MRPISVGRRSDAERAREPAASVRTAVGKTTVGRVEA